MRGEWVNVALDAKINVRRSLRYALQHEKEPERYLVFDALRSVYDSFNTHTSCTPVLISRGKSGVLCDRRDKCTK